MASLFSKPKMPKTVIPKPEAQPIPEKEDAGDIAKFMKKRSGRSNTILTGSLIPMDIGKRNLLG